MENERNSFSEYLLLHFCSSRIIIAIVGINHFEKCLHNSLCYLCLRGEAIAP